MIKEKSLHNQFLYFINKYSPSVYVINNLVTKQLAADTLSVIGARPIMAVSEREVKDICSTAQGLCINTGTPEKNIEKTYYSALKTSIKYNIPLVLDFPGLGASSYRMGIKRKILKKLKACNKQYILRGNGSEIINFLSQKSHGGSIDSSHSAEDALNYIKQSKMEKNVFLVSGKNNYVVSSKTTKLPGASALMAYSSGFGCISTALIGSFISLSTLSEKFPDDKELFSFINNDNFYEDAVIAVLKLMSEACINAPDTPLKFRQHFIDRLYEIHQQEKNNINIKNAACRRTAGNNFTKEKKC